MGLISGAIKLGAVAVVANQGVKAYEKHKHGKVAQQQQHGQYRELRDASGYLHQPWCNGSCGSQCNGHTGHAIRSIDEPVYGTPANWEKGSKVPVY